ncbi:hypothetical protein Rt10032_c01g0588 [Rhodotorula toruloides]|uniref:Proteophosphoglycan ppg4 n=1 Tax=Rhodotorula toruloides TaxID=5286 RepID=A0A511K898_RHOTO|nr:hypothetical protein Rt10032_c01g0588 [Rhodotorula toruloides]
MPHRTLRLFRRSLPLFVVSLVLLFSTVANAAIAGTQIQNISSDSTQLTYVGTWRSDTTEGFYQAYSNASDASVTFSFIGVGVSYLAEKKADRGICQLTVDGSMYYTLDLYNDSTYTSGLQVIWTSGTLLYGAHNITISQLGPDARFGYYPYLVTSTWSEAVPTDVPNYTRTQITPSATPTSGPLFPTGHSVNRGAIIGGVVGGVVACGLFSFLLYLWRSDRAKSRRSEGAPVHRVKRADGKMTIDDEADSKGAMGPYAGYGAGYAGYPYDPYGYNSHAAAAAAATYGYGAPYGHDSTYSGASGWPYPQPYSPSHGPAPRSASSAESHNRLYTQPEQSSHPPAFSPPAGAAPTPRGSAYDSAYHSGDGAASNAGSQSYPYHIQGHGNESRAYPIPEI